MPGIAIFMFGFILLLPAQHGFWTLRIPDKPMLLLIALLVWIGAAQKEAAAEMKTTFTNATVREAMLTDFQTLAPGQALGDATRLLLPVPIRTFRSSDEA